MHNSDKVVSHHWPLDESTTLHKIIWLNISIQCVSSTQQTVEGLQQLHRPFSKIHIPYFVFLPISGLSLQYCQQWIFLRNMKSIKSVLKTFWINTTKWSQTLWFAHWQIQECCKTRYKGKDALCRDWDYINTNTWSQTMIFGQWIPQMTDHRCSRGYYKTVIKSVT